MRGKIKEGDEKTEERNSRMVNVNKLHKSAGPQGARHPKH